MAIEVIAFDADDTLWVNEPYFREAEQEYARILSAYGTEQDICSKLYQTEMHNLAYYGYGIKGFTLSMVETALSVSQHRVTSKEIDRILQLGKSMLDIPVELLPEVEDTLATLRPHYKLVVATKGDLVDQQRKLQRSGLSSYFQYTEIMSDKTVPHYQSLIRSLQIHPEEFLMVGNSIRSDIQPVIEAGGHAVHVPFEITWEHEKVENYTHERMTEIPSIDLLPTVLHTFSVSG